MIETHYHLDVLEDLSPLPNWFKEGKLTALIAPATGWSSLQRLLILRKDLPYPIHLAVGLHPERDPTMPLEEELHWLLDWTRQNRNEVAAIGEVGLPHYALCNPAPPSQTALRRLEPFLDLAEELDLPVILHAVHEQAAPALELLKAHKVRRAVFHWLKADPATVQEILQAGCFISVTPSVCHNSRDGALACSIPINQLLLETDGPFDLATGLLTGQPVQPTQITDTLQWLASHRGMDPRELEFRCDANARTFFSLPC